jgi:UDP-glucuronate decarboxylase
LVERLLGDGHHVIVLDNLFTGSMANLDHRAEFVRGDVCAPFHFDVDVVYHLACPASPVHYQRNPVRTIKTAVQGTIHALECARDANAAIVVASTSECYGDPIKSPQVESDWGNCNPVGERACYDEGKRCGEALAVSWAKQYGTRVRIARIFNTYGPRMASGDGRLIPNLVTQALRGEKVTVYGDGCQTRSFCYVTDTVDAIVKLAGVDGRDGVVPLCNVGNPDERTILSVAEDVLRLCGRPETDVDWRPLPKDDPRQRRPDVTRIRVQAHWEPTTSYEDGLKITVDYFRKLALAGLKIPPLPPMPAVAP